MASKRDKLKSTQSRIPGMDEMALESTSILQNIVKGEDAEYSYLSPGVIVFNPNNDYRVGDSEEDIIELANDIKRNGLLHNIVVSFQKEDETYMLLSGERRLKAYMYLEKTYPSEVKWKKIFAQIQIGLTPLQEIIILDAANLESRGGKSSRNGAFRRGVERFIENLKKEYDMSEKDAMSMVSYFSGVGEKTLTNERRLERDLIPELQGMVDDNYLTKQAGYIFSSLPIEEQQHLLENITPLLEASDVVAISNYSKDALDAIKNDSTITEVPVRPTVEPVKEKVIKTEATKIINQYDRAFKAITTLMRRTEVTNILMTSDGLLDDEEKNDIKEKLAAMKANIIALENSFSQQSEETNEVSNKDL